MIPSGSLVPGVDPAAFGLPAGTALRYERPAEPLRPLLPSYAVLDSDPAVFTGPHSWILPGSAQLWIVLTRGMVTVQARKQRPAPLGATAVYGPSSRAMPTTSQGGVTVVVDLSPMGWARWIDHPAHGVRDQIVPLDRFWSQGRTHDLIARLHRCDRGTQVAPLLDDFFLSALPPPHRDEPLLARLSALMRGDGVPSIAEMAAALGLSQSTLLRLANTHFGFPPKLLLRRARFLRVLAAMMIADEASAPGTVPAGYHDASHFLRDAEEFLGLTPRRFLALPMPYLRSALRARTMVIGAPLPMLD